MLDDARTFLSRAVPWPKEGDPWWINIHHTWTPPNAKRAVLPGRAFKHIDDAVSHIHWLLSGQPTDVYVCMSGQSQAKHGINKAGWPIHRAERSADHAVAFRGVWLDVDVKAGAYASTGTALDAVMDLCKVVGKPSCIVMSGSGGFHVHWWAQTMSKEVWSTLAHGLQNACIANGLTVDGNVIVNPAQVLRIPSTFNWKNVS